MALLSTKIYLWDHFTIDTFAILILLRVLGFPKNPPESVFRDIFVLDPFSFKFVTLKTYHHWKEKG